MRFFAAVNNYAYDGRNVRIDGAGDWMIVGSVG